MNNPSWLKKLSPGELQLLRDLADVFKHAAVRGWQDTMTVEIRQEIERRSKNNIISTMTQAIRRSRRGGRVRKERENLMRWDFP